MRTTILWSLKRWRRNPSQARQHMEMLSRGCQGDRTLGATNPTAAGRPNVAWNIVMQSMKTGTLNNSRTRLNCLRKSTTYSQSRNQTTRCYRHISNMTASVGHDTPGQKGLIWWQPRWRQVHLLNVLIGHLLCHRWLQKGARFLHILSCRYVVRYDDEVSWNVSKSARRLQVQTKSQRLDSFDWAKMVWQEIAGTNTLSSESEVCLCDVEHWGQLRLCESRV